VLALGSLTAGAFAAPNQGPGDGPQTANIPYVAWVGEHLRLVVCDPSIVDHTVQFANYQVEDWSGYQFQPPTPDGEAGNSLGQLFDPGPAAFFKSSEPAHANDSVQNGCVATDYKSLNPGLSRIRVDIRDEQTGAVVFSHQFLAIWLTANKPTLSEAGAASSGSETFQSQLDGTGQGNYSHFLGDPAGDGMFSPSPFTPSPSSNEEKGLVQIRITGSFPIVKESPLSNILGNPSYTLPNEWATLAGVLSSSSEETEPPGSNPGLWDIHGTPGEATTSNGGTSSDPLHDVFFRPAFGNNTSGETATVGPFDPQAANETLLSDSRLNPDDAPMPAMRIDMSIAKNTGGSDLGGVGQLSGASKAVVYSHSFDGNSNAGGNLYNPYYGAYIPATDRPVNEASGVDGPSPGGNFPGFLNEHPAPYTYWTSVRSSNYRSGSQSTGCLRRVNAQPSEYMTPTGALTETFYTDERGEAYVTYTAGNTFYLENLPVLNEAGENEEGKVIKNENGGCDLKNVFDKTIGESVISANAVYPYEPVDYPAQASEGSLTKTVVSKWEKEWFEFPKGVGANEQNVKIVVAKAQDIDGHPFAYEKVCFHAQQNSGLRSYGGISGYIKDPTELLGKGTSVYVGGSSMDGGQEGTEFLCVNTNEQGLATIEVENSSFGKVDLTVTYEEEHVYRDHNVLFPTNAGGLKEAEEAKRHEEEVKQHEKEALRKAHEAEEEATKKANEEKAKAEAEQVKAEEEATKKANEEAIAKASNEEKLALETKLHEEEAATKLANEEKLAAAKKAREEEEAATKVKHEEEVAALLRRAATTTITTSGPASLVTPIPGGLSGAKPLTEAQKLAKALKACHKLAKQKRVACETQARKAHSAKHKKHKK